MHHIDMKTYFITKEAHFMSMLNYVSHHSLLGYGSLGHYIFKSQSFPY